MLVMVRDFWPVPMHDSPETTSDAGKTASGANQGPDSTPPQRQQLILLGSQNIKSFLQQDDLFSSQETLKEIDPIWLELGSGDALHAAVRVFENGQGAGSDNRVGFIGMSSCGTSYKEDHLAGAKEHQGNTFLVIHIARAPLVLFYRGKNVKDLLGKPHHSTSLLLPADKELVLPDQPIKISYDFVTLKELKPLFRDTPGVRRFFPKGNSCTRYRFARAYDPFFLGLPTAGQKEDNQKQDNQKEPEPQFNWSTLEGVEDLPKFFPPDDFVEIMTEPQEPLGTRTSADRIHAAIICRGNDTNTCDTPLMENYVLIFKLGPNASDAQTHKIANPAECRVAQHYAEKLGVNNEIEKDCIIRRKAENGIIQLPEKGKLEQGKRVPLRIARCTFKKDGDCSPID